MISNEGSDLNRLVLVNLTSGKETVVDSDPLGQVDLGQAFFDEANGALLMTRYIGDTARLYPKTPEMKALLAATRRAGGGVVEIGSGTSDRSKWVVTLHTPTRPAITYIYSAASRGLEKFYEPRPRLRVYRFAEMKPIAFTARDGIRLGGYVTLPPGVPPQRLPLVVLVHGGPWGDRDKWEFQSDVQLLANRGYAVLQVNYRGTTGLGKRFARGAKKQFGRAMHTDLLDGIDYLAHQGMIDTSRVAIMGGSYGGYATLVGLTFTPERFACAVDYAGTSNLVTLLESFPPSWGPFLPRSWYPFVGDPRNPADRADMISRSPLFRADSARSPLLIFQGANDPRVTKPQADAIALALHRRKIPVTYLLASNEGHGFGEAETSLAVNRATELFLGKCLGGRVQPSVSPGVEAALKAMLVNVDTLKAN
jgi:dipeptidyl aminopeptidase/acylaminoacyl peptidase